MTQHTPGPWRYEESTKTIRDERNHWLASMDSFDGTPDHAANARLIAQAPAMLEALKEMVHRYEALCAMTKTAGGIADTNAARAILRAVEGDK